MSKKAPQNNPEPVAEEVKESPELEEMRNKYLRALADYQNLEKRMSGALEQARSQSQKNTVVRFIDILDDMEKAAAFVTDPGLSMIMKRFMEVLAQAGVTEIAVEGTEFDPYVAEAVEAVPGETDNMVVEVVRKGYKIGDQVIRPAQVKVSKMVN